MPPQLGVGGCTPRPRKDSDDSRRIIWATPNVPTTMMGEMTLGSMCRNRIRKLPPPRPLAASMNSFSRRRLPSGESGVDHPSPDGQDENDVTGIRPEDARDGDGEENERKGQLNIGNPHGDVIEAPGEVAGEQSQADADGKREHHREKSDEERDARAADDARQDVAAEASGAEQLLRA